MSLKIEGKKCPVCNGYLFDEDEIVWCPDCGAPHHKDCYKTVGHCGFFELHGSEELEKMLSPQEPEPNKEIAETPNQEQPKVNVRCASCGSVFPMEYDKCPNCSAENMAKNGHFYMFDLLGGVKPNEDIGEGVTADKAKNFVAMSTNRYIPKFLAFKRGRKHFFSWWSFFFPAENFALRKMYPAAFFSGIVQTAGMLLLYPLSLVLNQLGLEKTEDMYDYIMQGMSQDVLVLFYLALAGLTILFLYRLISGFIFDKLYYKHTISKIKEIEETCETKEETVHAYRKHGGLNMFSFLLTFMILQYLPSIIASFIL